MVYLHKPTVLVLGIKISLWQNVKERENRLRKRMSREERSLKLTNGFVFHGQNVLKVYSSVQDVWRTMVNNNIRKQTSALDSSATWRWPATYAPKSIETNIGNGFKNMRSSIVICIAFLLVGTQRNSFAEDELRFSRDILPLLSDKCLACHGPDEQHRKADLRLDTREDATAHAIVPGDSQKSELMRRILSKDPDEVMPPPSHNKKLTADEISTFSRWIEGGAVWGKHWFFEKPLKAPISSGDHPIDSLVQARLSKEGLKLAPEAEKHTLLRRVSFDLTGLPPTLAQLSSDASYETQVDSLLGSPHFGERMAMWWLDAARYSDTDGFQADAERNNWPWRDWVVEAFNSNKRFDQFTLEQFAGDLLPDATPEQQLQLAFIAIT